MPINVKDFLNDVILLIHIQVPTNSTQVTTKLIPNTLGLLTYNIIIKKIWPIKKHKVPKTNTKSFFSVTFLRISKTSPNISAIKAYSINLEASELLTFKTRYRAKATKLKDANVLYKMDKPSCFESS